MSKNKVYINSRWISGETCVFSISKLSERLYAKGKISDMRKAYVEKLNDCFDIITNRQDIDKDTICLIMDEEAFDDKLTMQEYKKVFDQRIEQNAGSLFCYPKTVSLTDYFSSPFFPAVFKNEGTNGGKDKFLITNEEQLNIIKSFYDKYKDNARFNNELELSVLQQYIETPSKYATYIRVLAAGSGDILGASLKYSDIINRATSEYGVLDQVFLDPQSSYYLDTQKMFNYYSGGGEIQFCQPKFSKEKTHILSEHNIDSKNIYVPEQIMNVCSSIMHNCNQEIGVMCGFDFMMNKFDGKWYYLENQAFPAIDEWAAVKHIKLPNSHDVKGYLEVLKLSLQARDEALRLTINQRNNADYQPKLLK